jgi:hypothetical protein
MLERTDIPEVLYHFASTVGLSAILRSGYISLTENTLNIRNDNNGVV